MIEPTEEQVIAPDDRESGFWDDNPCGTAASWEKAQQLRFRYTDAYLLPVLTGALLSDRDVLEVGCGQGLDAERIVQQCRSYTGIDLSSVSVDLAREAVDSRKPIGTPTRFLTANAEDLPFDDETFDVVYSVGVLHHTANFDAALSECHRVLRKNGTLVLMLYRSYTPLWAVLRTVRAVLRLPVVGPQIKRRVIARERKKLTDENVIGGTAVLELFGCPIIDTYSLSALKRKFGSRFAVRSHSFHRLGLEQVVRILPPGLRDRWPQATTERLEDRFGRKWGFYMVAVAERD